MEVSDYRLAMYDFHVAYSNLYTAYSVGHTEMGLWEGRFKHPKQVRENIF